MKKVGIISKISHENFKSIVLMHNHVSVTSLSMLLHMLSELTLDYLIMIDSVSLCFKGVKWFTKLVCVYLYSWCREEGNLSSIFTGIDI